MTTVRPARSRDRSAMQEIERRAGEQFRALGLDAVADDEPPSLELLGESVSSGRCWVAVAGDDSPIGYVIAGIVDGEAHIEQVSVDPDHQGRGVGRALIDAVDAWALDQRLPAVTLTTFVEVPWNGPLYAHLGFTALAEDDAGPQLRAIRDDERARGLDDLSPRGCMRRAVGGR